MRREFQQEITLENMVWHQFWRTWPNRPTITVLKMMMSFLYWHVVIFLSHQVLMNIPQKTMHTKRTHLFLQRKVCVWHFWRGCYSPEANTHGWHCVRWLAKTGDREWLHVLDTLWLDSILVGGLGLISYWWGYWQVLACAFSWRFGWDISCPPIWQQSFI